MKPNHVILDGGDLSLYPRPWTAAVSAVNYPTKIVPAFYRQKHDAALEPAVGKTVLGSDKEYYFVLANPFREEFGLKPIACVTEIYGSMSTASIYRTLRAQLSEIAQGLKLHVSPRFVYISGNGGKQTLVVSVKGLASLKGLPDDLDMQIQLKTSVDGSRAHEISAMAHSNTGDTSIHLYGGVYNVKARHTTTIRERTINFVPYIASLLGSWESIIATMKFMYDDKFDRAQADAIIGSLSSDVGLAEKHRKGVHDLYRSKDVSNDTSDSFYRVYVTMNHYIEHYMKDRPELQERVRDNLVNSKEVTKRVNKAKGV